MPLDCDVIFSCVDRPWPRAVLNLLAYAHLVPVIDGGLRIPDPTRSNTMRGAGMAQPPRRTRSSLPGMPWSSTTRPTSPSNATGLLDDPRYIETLPADHHLRARENVFAFSTNLASLEVLQMLAMVVAPHGISTPGVQAYHFVSGDLDRDDARACEPNCRYSTVHVARGDNVEPGIAETHPVAERARAGRAETDGHVGKASWWRRLIRRV